MTGVDLVIDIRVLEGIVSCVNIWLVEMKIVIDI